MRVRYALVESKMRKASIFVTFNNITLQNIAFKPNFKAISRCGLVRYVFDFSKVFMNTIKMSNIYCWPSLTKLRLI